ncbi:MAG: hypothetical protein ACR2LL_05280 [Nitrosopumilus sp.]
MKILINDELLEIKFSITDKLAVMRGSFKIPPKNVIKVHSNRPKTEIGEVRLIGIGLPGAVKTGTFHTKRGRELWYVGRGDDNIMVIELENESYKNIILQTKDSQKWINQINKVLANRK